jgi:hypothetical protein
MASLSPPVSILAGLQRRLLYLRARPGKSKSIITEDLLHEFGEHKLRDQKDYATALVSMSSRISRTEEELQWYDQTRIQNLRIQCGQSASPLCSVETRLYIRVRGPAIIVTPIRSTAAAPAVARAHRFSLNSSQLEGYIRVSKPSNLTLLMKYIKTTTLLT